MVTLVKEFTLAGVPIRKVPFIVAGSAFGTGAAGLIGQNVLRLLTSSTTSRTAPSGCSSQKGVRQSDAGVLGQARRGVTSDANRLGDAERPHTTGTAY